MILGQEMLKSRDGAEKDEGELTGGKRLIFFIKMHEPKNQVTVQGLAGLEKTDGVD